MHTLIYTKVKDQLKAIPVLKELRTNVKDKASARVLEFWQGEVERCDQVLVGDGCEKVAEAYGGAGTTVKPLFEEPKKVEEVKPVEVVSDTVAEHVAVELVQETIDPVQEQPKRRGRPSKE